MPTLLIACGNTLRRDDGVAHQVLQLLPAASGRVVRSVHQLTPELAQEIACFDLVVFLDADTALLRPAIEPIGALAQRSPLTHAATPAEIVALARTLFGFTGEALLCRIPARDFAFADALSPDGLKFAEQAADELRNFI
ncbi:MAG: hydrogenase maturation protease [Bryobacteraceae bacterium]|jgi:Ni,Fe-hydrogenase maturation factor